MQSQNLYHRNLVLENLSPGIQYAASPKFFFWTHTPSLLPTLLREMKSALTPSIRELIIAHEGLGNSSEERADRDQFETDYANSTNHEEIAEMEAFLRSAHRDPSGRSSMDFELRVMRMYRSLVEGTGIKVRIQTIDIPTDDARFQIKLDQTLLCENTMMTIGKHPAGNLGQSPAEMRSETLRLYRERLEATFHADTIRNDVMKSNIEAGLKTLDQGQEMWVLTGAWHDIMYHHLAASTSATRQYVVIPDEVLNELPDHYRDMTTLSVETMKLRMLQAGYQLEESDLEEVLLFDLISNNIRFAARKFEAQWSITCPPLLNFDVQQFFATQCVMSMNPNERDALVGQIFNSTSPFVPHSMGEQAIQNVISPYFYQNYIARPPDTHNHAMHLLRRWVS